MASLRKNLDDMMIGGQDIIPIMELDLKEEEQSSCSTVKIKNSTPGRVYTAPGSEDLIKEMYEQKAHNRTLAIYESATFGTFK